jgi:2-C-methyl-D-erythritol 4-phosphate cytidylyltransferase
MQKYAIIVAGGSGSRMQSDLPKQFIKIGNEPILMHTIRRFYEYSPAIEIILVLSPAYFDLWNQLMVDYQFTLAHYLVRGGNSRAESVKNGLNVIQNPDSLVAIHDGVRPFVSSAIIAQSFKVAQEKGNAITSIPLKDSIREVIDQQSVALDRNKFRLMQTPQTFQTALILKAFELPDVFAMTDEASILEKAGYNIHLIEGDYKNIKITTPEDLSIAKAFLE